MTETAYRLLVDIRSEFSAAVERWNNTLPNLRQFQERLRIDVGYDDYTVETPIVYNADLDALGPGSTPRWILVADNPGKNEQKAANRRYLVGQAGKLAAGFFQRELGLDFRRDVVIINKTPIHTPKTAELAKLVAMDETGVLRTIFEDSQRFMATIAFRLHTALGVPVWIAGKSGLSPRGLFSAWFGEFSRLFTASGAMAAVHVFSHFSMNQFAIELKKRRTPGASLDTELARIGTENRRTIFGR